MDASGGPGGWASVTEQEAGISSLSSNLTCPLVAWGPLLEYASHGTSFQVFHLSSREKQNYFDIPASLAFIISLQKEKFLCVFREVRYGY